MRCATITYRPSLIHRVTRPDIGPSLVISQLGKSNPSLDGDLNRRLALAVSLQKQRDSAYNHVLPPAERLKHSKSLALAARLLHDFAIQHDDGVAPDDEVGVRGARGNLARLSYRVRFRVSARGCEGRLREVLLEGRDGDGEGQAEEGEDLGAARGGRG